MLALFLVNLFLWLHRVHTLVTVMNWAFPEAPIPYGADIDIHKGLEADSVSCNRADGPHGGFCHLRAAAFS